MNYNPVPHRMFHLRKSEVMKKSIRMGRRQTMFNRHASNVEAMFQHHCDLQRPPDLLERYICDGVCVNFRRKMKSYQICSERNVRTELFFKSEEAILGEKYAHLQNNFNMVHPFSIGRALWEYFMLFVYIMTMYYYPLYVSIARYDLNIPTVKLAFDLISWADIVMWFCTGYQHHLTKKVIMNRKLVAQHYLRTWFVIDVASSAFHDFFILLVYMQTGVNIWYLRFLALLKVLRLRTILEYLQKLEEWGQFRWHADQLIKMVLGTTIITTWCASVLLIIAWQYKEPWLPDRENYWQCLWIAASRTVDAFMLIGKSNSGSKAIPVLVLEIIYIIGGWWLRMIWISVIAMIILKSNALGAHYNRLVHEFREYIERKRLPKAMKKRILAYLEFRFHQRYYKEKMIYDTLSNRLKQEINYHTCAMCITEVPLFRHLPSELINIFSNILKPEIFLPNDVITFEGNNCDYAVFLTIGLIATYNAQGVEASHLTEGDYYGVNNLFENDPRSLQTLVALDFCEVYIMEQYEFKKALSPYPEIWFQLSREIREDLSDDASIDTHITRISRLSSHYAHRDRERSTDFI